MEQRIPVVSGTSVIHPNWPFNGTAHVKGAVINGIDRNPLNLSTDLCKNVTGFGVKETFTRLIFTLPAHGQNDRTICQRISNLRATDAGNDL